MFRILYIEDEKEIGQWVTKELTERGFEVKWLESGEGFEKYIGFADVVILDVMLPGLDGFSIGKRIKRENSELPILMLSARTAVEDKIEGLNFADDYLTKPFHPDELVARIEVLLRRYQKNDDVVELQHLKIHTKEMRIIDCNTNKEIQLTGKQFYLFQYFIRHLNQILTKEQLYEGVWGEAYIEGDKTLMVHIRYLREKIELNPAIGRGIFMHLSLQDVVKKYNGSTILNGVSASFYTGHCYLLLGQNGAGKSTLAK